MRNAECGMQNVETRFIASNEMRKAEGGRRPDDHQSVGRLGRYSVAAQDVARLRLAPLRWFWMSFLILLLILPTLVLLCKRKIYPKS